MDKQEIVLRISVGLMLAGLAIIGYQGFMWLKYGQWLSISLLNLFQYNWGVSQDLLLWSIYGGNWEGLRKLLDFIPVSLTIMASGYLVLITA